MSNIAPFKGILYNPEKIADPSKVIAPPYDVISKTEQEGFHKSHPNNVIRLILGKTTPKDTDNDNPHTRAAKYFKDWQNLGVLARDPDPCFYLLGTEFKANGQKVTRLGLICCVGLEPFESGAIRPHEQTFSKVKSERLALFKKTHANFSPIFSLCPDPEGKIFEKLDNFGQNKKSDYDFVDHAGQRQRLWRIRDAKTLDFLIRKVSQRSLYIADGHHRYETSLNYLEWLKSENPNLSATHPARFVMMYLSSMADPGMIILAAHRLLSRVSNEAKKRFFQKAPEYFDITEFPETGGQTQDSFLLELESQKKRTAIGVAMAGEPLRLFVVRPGVMDRVFAGKLAPELQDLDVSVLKDLIFIKLLGLSEADLDDSSLISYNTKHKQVISDVSKGRAAAGFILNPTRIEHVRAVAKAGLIMPRKSTYFYPKVITGMVMNSLTTAP